MSKQQIYNQTWGDTLHSTNYEVKNDRLAFDSRPTYHKITVYIIKITCAQKHYYLNTKSDVVLRDKYANTYNWWTVGFIICYVWLTGLVEVVSTGSRWPKLITCYSINSNDFVTFFVCFQLESQIKRNKFPYRWLRLWSCEQFVGGKCTTPAPFPNPGWGLQRDELDISAAANHWSDVSTCDKLPGSYTAISSV